MCINDINNKNSDCIKEKESRSFYIQALNRLYRGDIDAAHNYFKQCSDITLCALCLFLEEKIDEAYTLLEQNLNLNPAVNWLLCLIDVIEERPQKHVPSYFQIRNFYEIFLNLLIQYKKFEYAGKIIKNIEYFACFNKETYKYTARVFMDAGLYGDALLFLKKSIDVYYKDPEVHFMLGEIYCSSGNKTQAENEFVTADEVSGGYYPAQKRLKEITVIPSYTPDTRGLSVKR